MGRKRSVTLHETPGESGLVVQEFACAKSPVREMLETVRAMDPEFVTVTVWDAEAVETGCVPKLSVAGVTEIAAVVGTMAFSRGMDQMPRP